MRLLGRFYRRHPDVCSVLLLCALVACAFWKLILTRQFTFVETPDIVNVIVPWLEVQARALHHGTIALWDPFTYAGQPLLGQLQPGVANPLTYPLLALPLRDGQLRLEFIHFWFVFIHLLASCVRLCVLSRHWMSSSRSDTGRHLLFLGRIRRECDYSALPFRSDLDASGLPVSFPIIARRPAAGQRGIVRHAIGSDLAFRPSPDRLLSHNGGGGRLSLRYLRVSQNLAGDGPQRRRVYGNHGAGELRPNAAGD